MNLPPLPDFSTPMGKPTPLVRRPGLGIGTLFGAMLLATSVLGIICALFPKSIAETAGFIRITAVLQDLLVFILPAIVAAFVVTRLPATFLKIDFKPTATALFLAGGILIMAMPFLNFTVALNEALPLPEWLSSTSEKLEETVDDTMNVLLGNGSIGDLIFSILLVGVLTGISEELFFRGAMQGLFASTRMNKHIAVWVTAIIFSAMHMEIYGLLPRLLLGAYFGYLLWWTGSLWVPIFAHALNNTIVAVGYWVGQRSSVAEEVEEEITSLSTLSAGDYLLIAGSIILTALGLIVLYRYCFRKSSPKFSMPQNQ